ncbi:hypothetical protein [Achromobacter spanius]|uniref:hypothetical protein n=1 Tax=Achromobacter spanius TaxID=217203 RepID=UPI00382CB3AC
MPTFFMRVEVYGPARVDYNELHAELAERLIYGTVEVNGALENLPDGSYVTNDLATVDEVMNAIQAALRALGRQAGVVVAPIDAAAGGLKISNLRPTVEEE